MEHFKVCLLIVHGDLHMIAPVYLKLESIVKILIVKRLKVGAVKTTGFKSWCGTGVCTKFEFEYV
jgi:hypothetical protein